MNKVWKIARHTYLARLRRFGMLAAMLLGVAHGIVFFAILGALVLLGSWLMRSANPRAASDPSWIGVLDQGARSVPLPQAFTDRFESYADEEAAKKALAAGEVSVVIVRPVDYLDSGKVMVWQARGGLSRSDDEVVKAFLVAWLLEGKVDPGTVSRVNAPVDLEVVHLGADGKPRPQLEVLAGAMGILLSILLIFLMHFSSLILLGSLAEEQSGHVLELLLSSVSPAQLLAGKAVGLLAVWLSVLAVGFLSLVVLSRSFALFIIDWVALEPQWFLLAGVFYLLGTMLFALPGVALAVLVKSNVEKYVLFTLFLALVVAPYVLVPLQDQPNTATARVLSVFPLTAPGVMLLRLAQGPVPLVDVFASIAVLLVSIPLAFGLAVKVFRTGLLLYGKPPGLGHLLRAFRQA